MSAKQKKIFEGLYFALLVVSSINLFLLTTVFKYEEYEFILDFVQFVLQFSIVVKVVLEWKTRWTNKDILLGILTAGIFMAAACRFNNEDAYAYAFLILGAKDIDKKKILKVFIAVNAVMFALTIGACELGFIQNITTYRNLESSHARVGLGFIYTTALSAHFLTLVVCYVFVREKKISIVEIILIGISSGVIYYLTEARIASFTIFLIFIGLVVAKICYMKNVEFKLVRFKLIKYLMIYASGILMLVSVIMGTLYKFDSAFWAKINHVLSERPLTNAITFNRYPITMLGNHVLFHCKTFDGMNELPDYYYIINCSYIGVLFSLGILGALAVLITWITLSYKEEKNGNYLNLYILAVLTLFFFFEQRFFDFIYNPLYILLFATYAEGKGSEIYDIRFLKKYKHGNLVFRSILTGLAIAFVIESVGFNYNSVKTFLFERTTIDSADVTTDGLYGNAETDLFENTCLDPMLILNDLKTYSDLQSIFIDFNFMTKEDNRHYKLVEGVQYSVDYYSAVALEGNAESYNYDYVGTAEIDSSRRCTAYIPTIIEGPIQNIVLKFNFPDNYYIDIAAIDFNGPRPFDINYGRLALMCAAISAILSLVAIKNGDKSADDDSNGEGDSDSEFEHLKEGIEEDVKENIEDIKEEVRNEAGC